MQEQDGTTASARWISLDAWPSLAWTANWQLILTDSVRLRRSRLAEP